MHLENFRLSKETYRFLLFQSLYTDLQFFYFFKIFRTNLDDTLGVVIRRNNYTLCQGPVVGGPFTLESVIDVALITKVVNHSNLFWNSEFILGVRDGRRVKVETLWDSSLGSVR